MRIYIIDIHRIGLKCDNWTTPVQTNVGLFFLKEMKNKN
jgi:hypothetical protein